ncbi:MAG TPA: DUF882 domain-containing protein [Steroidobacteraceae bacterium]|nr:DUF882 domain-containing protein [Steroidobacteraceae bacterium]
MRRPASPVVDSHQIDRRQFLRRVAAATLTMAPIGAALAGAAEQRSVSFVHTHTGEELTAVYFQDGRYQPGVLHSVNHLLRDFRTGDVHPIDPAVLDILFDLQLHTQQDRPFEVISGYRSPRTNAALRQHSSGVAEHSLHIQGRAIDVRVSGVPTRTLRDAALFLQRGGVGFYPGSDFVHLDNGRIRYW